MNVFGIGLPELAVIAAIGLLVFGPKRLPELGKTLGRTLRGFQSASQEFEQEFRNAIGTDNALSPGSTGVAPLSHAPLADAALPEAALPEAAAADANSPTGETAGAEAGSGPA
jgi:sec-independent protein translocase protein TatA